MNRWSTRVLHGQRVKRCCYLFIDFLLWVPLPVQSAHSGTDLSYADRHAMWPRRGLEYASCYPKQESERNKQSWGGTVNVERCWRSPNTHTKTHSRVSSRARCQSPLEALGWTQLQNKLDKSVACLPSLSDLRSRVLSAPFIAIQHQHAEKAQQGAMNGPEKSQVHGCGPGSKAEQR